MSTGTDFPPLDGDDTFTVDVLGSDGSAQTEGEIPGESKRAKAKRVKLAKARARREKTLQEADAAAAKPAKARKTRSKSRGGSDTSVEATGVVTSGIDGWLPTVSSFDLLGGEYAIATRRRLVLLVAIGALIVFAAAMLLRLAATFIGLQEQNASLDQARASQTQMTAEYASITGTSGATLEQILNHVQNKGRAIVQLTGNEAPVNVLVTVLQSAPVGTTITAVELGDSSVGAGANTGTGGPATYPLRVTATVSEQTLIPTLVEAVRAIPGVQSVDAAWGGSDGEGTVTLTLQVAASNTQSQELAARFGIESAVTEGPDGAPTQPGASTQPGAPSGTATTEATP